MCAEVGNSRKALTGCWKRFGSVVILVAGADYNLPVHPNHNSRMSTDQCPYSLHLEWNHQEWVTDDPQTHCPAEFRPRDVTIADNGTITAKPGAVVDTGESR
jgi:hypothetical protein